jgi:hypothetical protein
MSLFLGRIRSNLPSAADRLAFSNQKESSKFFLLRFRTKIIIFNFAFELGVALKNINLFAQREKVNVKKSRASIP